MALGILGELKRTGKIPKLLQEQHNSTEYLHSIIKALRIAFADASWWVTDPNMEKVPTKELILQAYLSEQAKLYSPNQYVELLDHESPAHNHCDTVYFTVTDKDSNGISFINSNFAGFGTSIIPNGCGFALQDRDANFYLTPDHPNALTPRKRPYHSATPGYN